MKLKEQPETPEECAAWIESIIVQANNLYSIMPTDMRNMEGGLDQAPLKSAWRGLILFLDVSLHLVLNGSSLREGIYGYGRRGSLRTEVMFAINSLTEDVDITLRVVASKLEQGSHSYLLEVENPLKRISDYLKLYEREGFIVCIERGRGRSPSKYRRTNRTITDYILKRQLFDPPMVAAA